MLFAVYMAEGNVEANAMALMNPKHVTTVVSSTGSAGEAQRYWGQVIAH